MRKILLGVFVFTMIVGFGATAQSAYVQNNLDPVRFYVVDDTGDSSVTLDIQNIGFSGTLQFSTDNINWENAGPTETFTVSEGYGRQLVYWQIQPSTGPDITEGDLTFYGFDHDDLWNSVLTEWSDTSIEITFSTAAYDDNVAPVPIAPSVVLLGSGLFALLAFGYRRRSAQE